MKGVIELNWKIILILVGGLIAFAIILLVVTGLTEKFKDMFAHFTLADLINFWRGVACRFFGGCE